MNRLDFVSVSVAVTGHREVVDDRALVARISFVLDQIATRFGDAHEPAALTLVSALAEGADRLVAHQALTRAGASLEVVLPFAPEEYRRDFGSDDSRNEFDDLLASARRITVAGPSATAGEAYERAGRAVVDRCDIVVALWNGLPSNGRGGTAEIVEYARTRLVPVVVIATSPPYTVEAGDLPPVPRESEDAKEFEGLADSDPRLRAHMNTQERWWRPADETRFKHLGVADLSAAVKADFARADLLALEYQEKYERSSRLAFLLPAIAVIIVTIQSRYYATAWWLAGAESLVLLWQFGVLWRSHRRRLHIRWISYRFLAERLRSAYFLTLAGSGEARPRERPLTAPVDPTERWSRGVVDRVIRDLLAVNLPAGHVEELRDYLAEQWIDAQIAYHCRATSSHARYVRLFGGLTVGLFVVALIAAGVHAVLLYPHEHGPDWLGGALISLSIMVPAVGAASHGFSSLREYTRHADQSAHMARRLRRLRREMADAADFAAVRTVAADVEAVMREENSDWFGVARYHDIELVP